MRYLHHHGWINFRMRAMLVSVATYSLSLPWQPVASWLAQQFVDFEPGIHYPQIQMQSGLSDQQVLRIYNPITQAFNLDEAGDFVRRWVPELAQVSTNWIFEPWKMPANIQAQVGWTRDYFYPAPLVDFEFAHRLAKQEITHLRAQHSLPPANKHQHSTPSTRPSAPQSNHHPQSAHQQLDLFS
jgi:deoxyribodipyrimidine photo-lyase